MTYILDLAKENFKFAAAHFAIFGPGCAERLHGHNYYVSLQFKTTKIDNKLGLSVEFNELKPLVKKACEELDEFVLFPQKSPYLKITKEKINKQECYKIIFAKKTYILPAEDVKLVPVLNISCEELSLYIWNKLKKDFKKYPQIKSFTVTVEETRGQKGAYTE